jgi:hypothetical protein
MRTMLRIISELLSAQRMFLPGSAVGVKVELKEFHFQKPTQMQKQ